MENVSVKIVNLVSWLNHEPYQIQMAGRKFMKLFITELATVIWVILILWIMNIYILIKSSDYFIRKDQWLLITFESLFKNLKVELQRSKFFQYVNSICSSRNEPSKNEFQLINKIDRSSFQLRPHKLYHISLSIMIIVVMTKGLIEYNIITNSNGFLFVLCAVKIFNLNNIVSQFQLKSTDIYNKWSWNKLKCLRNDYLSICENNSIKLKLFEKYFF